MPTFSAGKAIFPTNWRLRRSTPKVVRNQAVITLVPSIAGYFAGAGRSPFTEIAQALRRAGHELVKLADYSNAEWKSIILESLRPDQLQGDLFDLVSKGPEMDPSVIRIATAKARIVRAGPLPWHALVYVTLDGRVVIHQEFLSWLGANERSRVGRVTKLRDVLGHEFFERNGGTHGEARQRFPLSATIEDQLNLTLAEGWNVPTSRAILSRWMILNRVTAAQLRFARAALRMSGGNRDSLLRYLDDGVREGRILVSLRKVLSDSFEKVDVRMLDAAQSYVLDTSENALMRAAKIAEIPYGEFKELAVNGCRVFVLEFEQHVKQDQLAMAAEDGDPVAAVALKMATLHFRGGQIYGMAFMGSFSNILESGQLSGSNRATILGAGILGLILSLPETRQIVRSLVEILKRLFSIATKPSPSRLPASLSLLMAA